MAANKKKDSNTAQVEERRIRQILTGYIIIGFAFKLFFPLREKCSQFYTIYKTKTLGSAHLLCPNPKKKKERKRLRGRRGHLNCFILRQTRHVIKIPQDALIKLAKLIQIISLISQTKAHWKTSIRLFKQLGLWVWQKAYESIMVDRMTQLKIVTRY